jgi:hypothetical protein
MPKELLNAIYDPNFKCLKRFFKQAKEHLVHPHGRILIVYTNLSECLGLKSGSIIQELCEENGFRKRIIAKKTVHNETYTIYELFPLWGELP